MATNQPTILALEDLSNKIDNILSQLRIGSLVCILELDELEAYNRLLKEHVEAQRKQKGQFPTDSYAYNPKTKKLERRREGKLVGEV